jgi:hypothetical protein
MKASASARLHSSRPKKRPNRHIMGVTVFVSGSRVLILRPYWTACFSWKGVLRFVGVILGCRNPRMWRTAMILINAYNMMIKDEDWKRPAHQQREKTLDPLHHWYRACLDRTRTCSAHVYASRVNSGSCSINFLCIPYHHYFRRRTG